MGEIARMQVVVNLFSVESWLSELAIFTWYGIRKASINQPIPKIPNVQR